MSDTHGQTQQQELWHEVEGMLDEVDGQADSEMTDGQVRHQRPSQRSHTAYRKQHR